MKGLLARALRIMTHEGYSYEGYSYEGPLGARLADHEAAHDGDHLVLLAVQLRRVALLLRHAEPL